MTGGFVPLFGEYDKCGAFDGVLFVADREMLHLCPACARKHSKYPYVTAEMQLELLMRLCLMAWARVWLPMPHSRTVHDLLPEVASRLTVESADGTLLSGNNRLVGYYYMGRRQ